MIHPEADVVAARLLSQREKQIMDLMIRGYEQWEIAEKLCAAPSTIATHVRRAKLKLSARTTEQACALFAAFKAPGDREFESWMARV